MEEKVSCLNFNVLFGNLPGTTEESHENPKSVYPGLTLEPRFLSPNAKHEC
jgi:hypothetical protein